MAWVWKSSRAEPTDRLVLLAIADAANDQGADAYPSMATLTAKTNLHERSIQRALKRLVELGELVVYANAGPRGCNRYRIPMTPGTESPPAQRRGGSKSPRQTTTPAESPVTPGTEPPPPRQPATPPPGTAPPEPSLTHPITIHEPSNAVAVANGGTITQRSKRITDAYTAVEPMSKWPAVNAIVIRAIKTERWSDDEIRAAVLRMAGDGRSITVDSLRVELDGLPPSRAAPRQSVTNSRVGVALDLADELERNPGRLELER